MTINLRAFANSVTSAINRNRQAWLYIPIGYTTADDGSRELEFRQVEITVQTQQATGSDVQILNGMYQQSELLSVYVDGRIEDLDRLNNAGQAEIVFKGYGSDENSRNRWKVVAVPEMWDKWCRIIVCRQ